MAVNLELRGDTLDSALRKFSAVAKWDFFYADHAGVIGPKNAVAGVQAILKKKPITSPERIPMRARLQFGFAEPQQVAEFLNERSQQWKIDLHLQVQRPSDRTVLMFAQRVIIFEAIWLISASLGGTPEEIFGPKSLPR